MHTIPTARDLVDTGRAAVAVLGVTRTFGRGESAVRALDDVTFAVEAGSFTAVMGPSGSGKSTLLQVAAGLDRPDSGTVVLAGQDLTGRSERRLATLRRERVGFVFQAFNLLDALTAAQNVALPARLAGHRLSRRQVREALDQVGLADRARQRPSQLSGGQQQRVALARALVSEPEVVFADEPTGALDRASGRGVLQLLRDVVDRRGQTVVMVTHDANAAAWAEHVVFLADGRLAGELLQPTAERVAEHLTALGA